MEVEPGFLNRQNLFSQDPGEKRCVQDDYNTLSGFLPELISNA
jgi:hypothetical protein